MPALHEAARAAALAALVAACADAAAAAAAPLAYVDDERRLVYDDLSLARVDRGAETDRIPGLAS